MKVTPLSIIKHHNARLDFCLASIKCYNEISTKRTIPEAMLIVPKLSIVNYTCEFPVYRQAYDH
jgi:hypothetical protein